MTHLDDVEPFSAADLFPEFEAETLGADGRERFVVDSVAKAEWAALRLREARDEIAAHEVNAAELRARVDEAERNWTSRPRFTVAYFEALLTNYHRRQLHDAIEAGTPERQWPKTIALPSATLTSRAPGRGRVVIDDETALVDWLVSVDAADETTRRVVQKDALRSRCVVVEKDGAVVLVLDGEVVPHVHVEVDTEPSFSVRFPSSDTEGG